MKSVTSTAIQEAPTEKREHNIKFYKASQRPEEDLCAVAYEGQPDKMRRYKPGYEWHLEELPVIKATSPFRSDLVRWSKGTMVALAAELKESAWVRENDQPDGEFARTIVAMESPKIGREGLREGAELLVAHWGKGFASPVHGHAPGYMHEEILHGKILVNTYRMVNAASNIVRLIRTDIISQGTFVSEFGEPAENAFFPRQNLIHNFVALEPSASLHFVPEHTRDGRDNGFKVQYFDDAVGISESDVERIDSKQGMYSRIGDVILVRSTNVPEYGDHYIVITGHAVPKEHGLRPQDVALQAPTNKLLDKYEMQTGLILLKLKEPARNKFLRFHDIKLKDDGSFTNVEVIFPKP